MDNKNQDEKQGTRQGAGENEDLRHKGPVRSTPADQKSGPQPEGNGGTGKPAAFPPHN
jgi:secreted protein with Ig-like and vWFA domain